MAYVANDDQNDKKQSSVFGGDYPQTGMSLGAGPAQPSQTGQPTRQGTGFTNLRKYIEANKPQAQKMSEAIIKGTEKQAEQLKSDIGQKTSMFQTGLTPEQTRLSGGMDLGQQAITKAQAGETLSDEEMKKFQSLRKGTGEFQNIAVPDYTKLAQQGQELQNLGRNVGTTSGRFQLLSKTLGSPTYSSGQKTLDELILAGTKPARQGLVTGIQEATTGIGKEATTQQEANRQALLALRAQGEDVSEALQKQLSQAQTGFEEGLQSRLEEKQGDIYSQLREGLTGEKRQLTQEQLDALGITGGQLYDVDPTSYFYTTPTISNIATQEDLAKAQALSSLADQSQGTILDESDVGTYGEKAQAGLESLREAVQARQTKAKELHQQYMQEYTPVRNAYIEAVAGRSATDPGQLGSELIRIRQKWDAIHRGEFGTDLAGMGNLGKIGSTE